MNRIDTVKSLEKMCRKLSYCPELSESVTFKRSYNINLNRLQEMGDNDDYQLYKTYIELVRLEVTSGLDGTVQNE